MGGGLESRCVGRVCGADVAVRQHPHRIRIQKLGAENHMLQLNI